MPQEHVKVHSGNHNPGDGIQVHLREPPFYTLVVIDNAQRADLVQQFIELVIESGFVVGLSVVSEQAPFVVLVHDRYKESLIWK